MWRNIANGSAVKFETRGRIGVSALDRRASNTCKDNVMPLLNYIIKNYAVKIYGGMEVYLSH
jgi:hypothetical protein